MNGVTYDRNDGNVYASGSVGVTVFSPSGGPPKAGAPAAFAALNADGIAYDATTPNTALNRIAVGNTATPALAFFSETGSGRGSATLSAAPIAVAYGAPVTAGQSPQTLAQLYVTSAEAVVALGPTGAPVTSVSDSRGPFGIAVDLNSRQPQVVDRSANAVTTYLNDLSAVDAARSFSTPFSLGLTQPQGVCDVF